MYNALSGETPEDYCNHLNPDGDGFDTNSLLLPLISKVLSQSQLRSLRDNVTVALAICEVIDQINRLLPLISLLKCEQLGLRLRLILRIVIVLDKLHYELLAGQLMHHKLLAIHDWVWAAAGNPVLIRPAGETLPLANEKVDPSLHLLVVQKIKLSVRFLGGQDKAMVSF